MKFVKQSLFLLIVTSVSPSTNADGFFIGFDLGESDLKIDSATFPSLDLNTSAMNGNGFGGAITFGYELDNDWSIDLSFENISSPGFISFSDRVELQAVRAGVRYTIPSQSRFEFFGKTGLSFWQLEARKDNLFSTSPGPSAKRDGADIFLQVGLGYRITDRYRMSLSTAYGNHNFGDVTDIRLGVKFYPLR